MSRKKAQENIDSLRAYLDSVNALPAQGGKVSIAAVATAAGIDRQALYRNPTAKTLLDSAVFEKGLVGIEPRASGDRSEAEKALERQVRALEARNAALMAENADLRSRIRKFEHIEQMTVEGKRVIP
jgi:hypothetical protein